MFFGHFVRRLLDRCSSKGWLDSGLRFFEAGGTAKSWWFPHVWFEHDVFQGDHRYAVTIGLLYYRLQYTYWRYNVN